MRTFRATVLEANKPNKNRRIYPEQVLKANVERLSNQVKNKQLLGQIDFPNDALIHFENASHVITELILEDNKLIASIETLPTPQGKVLEKLLEHDAVALRPYGIGNGKVDENGVLVIDDSYKMISISVVKASIAS